MSKKTNETKESKKKDMVVTPWEVSGTIDYKKLVKKFGTTLLSSKEIETMKKYGKGELHLLLRRGLFFSHRDFDWILKRLEKGQKLCSTVGVVGADHAENTVRFHCTLSNISNGRSV